MTVRACLTAVVVFPDARGPTIAKAGSSVRNSAINRSANRSLYSSLYSATITD